ncbi:hypothetical protein A4U49_08680 [Acidithiobacillus ferrivorans]|uniref:methyltransferase domain-containing protein n=1 Tax=Acidithiobacillus ferrivorans TaxID=160808 RepID=UPI0008940E73|nr:methyltransferase domain-containing protein [Acidithiobacillus ferrivorans]OFA16194.1 hypothetical protein A4U49_08680 [Acidithiobacillus ferrivorans]
MSETPHLYERPPLDPDGSDSLACIARRIDPGSRVLDLGCAVGVLGRYLVTAKGCIVDGVESVPAAAAIARQTYHEVVEVDLEIADLRICFPDGAYDVIVCADVLEHLVDPGRVLDQLPALLASQGQILVSIPNVSHLGILLELLAGDFRYGPEGLLDATHLRFFTGRSFQRLLTDHGLAGEIVDRVILDVQESEFRNRLPEPWSPSLMAELGRRPESSTYQFIVAARPAAAGASPLPSVAAAPFPGPGFTIKLYAAGLGEAFSESHSTHLRLPLGVERQTVILPVPGRSMQRLRLDPGDRAGFLHLYHLRLLDDQQHPLWIWDGTSETLFDTLRGIFPAPLPGAQGGVLLTLLHEDPWILLPTPTNQVAIAHSLEITLSWPLSADYMAVKQSWEDTRLERQKLEHENDRLHSAAMQREATIAKREQAIAEREQTIARLHATIVDREAEITRVYASRSWRVTAPLRRGWKRLSRLRHARCFLAAEALGSGPVTDPHLEKSLALLFPQGELSALPPHGPVDLIVPVYNGWEHLEGFFTSLLAHSTEPYHLIIVDDASTDPRVWPFLEAMAAQRPDAVLLRNASNLGFVGTVNRALVESQSDVVLLNTDIRLPNLWLERLLAPLREPQVASVTPFTNAGTICSFPVCCIDNQPFLGLDVDHIDIPFARVDPTRLVVNLPTAVGFCMALSRRALDSVGMLDAEAFGKGYGEENDWCMRAHRQGWVHRLACNLYVHHQHGGSFAPEEKQRLLDRNLQTLFARYPEYPTLVDAFIAADTARPLRDTLALLLACTQAGQAAILIIDHRRGGGANHYRERQVERWRAAGHPVLVYVEDYLTATRTLETQFGDHRWSFQLEDIHTLLTLASELRFGEIWYNSAVFAQDPLVFLEVLAELQTRQQARLVITMHDFYPLCPSYTLVNAEDHYCELPDLATCARCLPDNRHVFTNAPREMVAWRKSWGRLLDLADTVLCFSASSADLVQRAYPNLAARIDVQPHSLEHLPRILPAWSANEPLHIGVIGAISFQKGAAVVQSFADLLVREAPSVRMTVVGTVDPAYPMPTAVRITERYRPEALPAILEDAGINLVWFPSIWPETFSYVTAEVIALGLPIACFDLGAPAERVRDYALGHILSSSDPRGLLRELMAFHAQLRSFGAQAGGRQACTLIP